MNKFYDTKTHTETYTESSTTIPHDDTRVKDFFKPLPDGYRVVFIDDLPVIEKIPDPTPAEIALREKNEANEAIKRELDELDKLSIRDIRAWIASQPDAPQMLKEREAQAVDARSRLQL